MKVFLHRFLITWAISLGCSLVANSAEQNVLEGLSGVWNGELYYLDYQSGQRFGIPMRVEASVTPDGATLTRNVTYTDPGNLVYVVNVVTITQEGQLKEAFFRDSEAQMLNYNIDSLNYKSESKWTLVYSHEGTDNNRPAKIRHTIQRDGEDLTSSKEVRFLSGEQSNGFFLRNGTELSLEKER
ncbi:MAG: hypothetical protein AAF438_04925 [Pseudomonadota bacterium]